MYNRKEGNWAARAMLKGAVAALAIVIAGAGSSFAQVGESARALLPADIRDRGYVTNAIDPSFGPINVFRSKENPEKMQGIAVDISEAIFNVLGLESRYDVTAFAGIIPGLQAGRWDIGGNSFSDTLARQEVVDMFDVFESYSVLMVPKGNPQGIKSVADLCGKDVGQTPGTAQLAYLETFSEQKCGMNKMKFLILKSRADVIVAMEAGRAGVHLISANSAIGNLDAKYNPENAAKFEIVDTGGEKLVPSLEAFAIPKTKPELKKAMLAAFQEIINNGAYQKILDSWGLGGTALPHPMVNSSKADW